MTINNKIIEFYTNFKVFVNTSITLELDENQKEIIKDYINSNGYRFDNHITWKNDSGICFTYDNGNIFIGNNMIVKNLAIIS